MFINFWYPVIQGRDLGDRPALVRMLGTDFVAFRDSSGAPHVLSNTCVHRGGSLAGGRVRGDCIECPYHGWRFDASGLCRRIPSLGADARPPSRARVDSYPVVERYGIVFAFLGDLPESERPPMLEIPEFDSPGWRPTWINYQVDYNYERSIENGMDPAHNEFVHPTHGFQGESDEYRVNQLRWVARSEWGFGFFHRFRSPSSNDADFASMKQQSDSREAGSGIIGPNHMWTYIRFAPDKRMHQYMWETPVDEFRTNIFFVNMRSTLLDPALDEKVGEKNWMIAEQDIQVLKDLHPVVTPRTNTKEFMVAADEPILRYREKLREWEARGWRIDGEALRRQAARSAFAVPSPERRRVKGWVLDTVPLLPAGEAAPGVAARAIR